MKNFSNLRQTFSLLFLIFLCSNSFSQINVQIENIVYNGSTIPNCSPINLNANNTHNITFNAKVDVADFDNGPVYTSGYLKIIYFSGSAAVTISNISIDSGDWIYENDRAYLNRFRNITLSSGDFDEPNGGSLYAIYQVGTNGIFGESCIHNITKPKFSIIPTALTINCNSTAARTFTVSNDNSSPGTLGYNWQVGTGWRLNGSIVTNFSTPTNTVDLVPYIYPPSDVHVTPVLSGVSTPQLTSSITLGSFDTTAEINGPNETCTTATYSIPALSGVTVSDWTVSNPSIASISVNGNQVTLTATGQGPIDLSATLTNTCDQTKIIVRPGLYMGKPKVVNYTVSTNATNFKINTSDQFSVAQIPSQGVSYSWSIVKLNSECEANAQGQYPAGTFFPRFVVGGGFSNTLTSSSRYATIDWGTCPGNYVVNVQVLNSCGVTDVGYRSVHVIDPYEVDPCLNRKTTFYPNPVKNGSVVVRIPDPNGPPCGPIGGKQSAKTSVENLINDVQIYNMMGRMVYKNSFDTYEFRIDDMNLNNGSYIIIIQDNLGNLDRQLLVINN